MSDNRVIAECICSRSIEPSGNGVMMVSKEGRVREASRVKNVWCAMRAHFDNQEVTRVFCEVFSAKLYFFNNDYVQARIKRGTTPVRSYMLQKIYWPSHVRSHILYYWRHVQYFLDPRL